MQTRREFIQTIPATGAAFTVAGHILTDGRIPPSLLRQSRLNNHYGLYLEDLSLSRGHALRRAGSRVA